MPDRLSSWFKERTDREQRLLVAGLFMIAQFVIWALVFEVLWYADRSITDTPVYYDYATHIFQGSLPYRDFASEYPPVAMLLFSLPRFFSGSSYFWFVFSFAVEMMLFSCGVVWLISLIAWRQWHEIGKVAGALFAYTVFLLFLGSIVELRFDLAAAFLILGSIACFTSGRRAIAWIILGAGIMTKIIPVLIAPLFLISLYRRNFKREMVTGPLIMIATAGLISIPFLLTAPAGLANAFLYHVERPLQLESSWSSPLLVLSKYSGYSVRIMNSYGSHNVFASASDTLAALSGPVTLLILLAGYWLYWRRSALDDAGSWDPSLLIRFAAIAVATFIFGGKVFSPQFLIWLIPIVPLIKGRDRGLVLGLFAAILLLTQWEFPARYWELYLLQKNMILVVAARNLLLGALIALMMLEPGRARQQSQVRPGSAATEQMTV